MLTEIGGLPGGTGRLTFTGVFNCRLLQGNGGISNQRYQTLAD